MTKQWIKDYVLENLTGSTRRDLEPAERSVWDDLLRMGGLSRKEREGFIERNKDIPYEDYEIANLLVVPVQIVKSAIEKCLKEGRLTRMPSGVLYITNWNKYQSGGFKKEKRKMTPEERDASELNALLRYVKRNPEIIPILQSGEKLLEYVQKQAG